MLTKFLTLFICLFLTNPLVEADTYSRGKQQKFFTKELKKTDLYLGMSLEKFTKERPNALVDSVASVFRTKYAEAINVGNIAAYTYLLTQGETPQLYSIEITYTSMDVVQSYAIEAMGPPNYNGEWRVDSKRIKEDFMMGAWNFGDKLVYGATLKGSEWENGFSN